MHFNDLTKHNIVYIKYKINCFEVKEFSYIETNQNIDAMFLKIVIG